MARTAILIHGRHLQANGWKDIVWGNPKGASGQVPKAIRQALLHRAELIIWGTGASEKDGMKESRYTFKFAMDHLDELPLNVGDKTYTVEDIRAYLERASVLDEQTQNTTEEIREALMLCAMHNIDELILVSSPSHIARCHQEALKLLAGGTHQVLVYATASDTCFEDSTAADVVIVEPPHRGDMPLWQTYRYVRAMFGLIRDPNMFAEFLERLGGLLVEFGIKVDWAPRK